MRLAASMLALAACLPTEDWPEADSDLAKSAFLAVELENGNFEVYASEVIDRKPSFPTVLVDGTGRVDVNFYACDLSSFDVGSRFETTALQMDPSLLRNHPKPISAFTTQVRAGRAEAWRASEDVVFYPCPNYHADEPVLLPDVDAESVWLVPAGASVYAGSKTGVVHNVDDSGVLTTSNGSAVYDVVTLQDAFYGIVSIASEQVAIRTGPTPDALTGLVEAPSLARPETRARLQAARSGSVINVAVADTNNNFFTPAGSTWTSEKICDPVVCPGQESTDVYVVYSPSHGFVAAVSDAGCVFAERDIVPRLPSCGTLTGLTHKEGRGLVALIGASLWTLVDREWVSVDVEPPSAKLASSADSILLGSAEGIAQLFANGPLCTSPIEIEGRIIALAPTPSGPAILVLKGADVFLVRVREVTALNGCAV